MTTGLPTGPLASRLINQRAAAPWITLHRRTPLIIVEILSKLMGPALRGEDKALMGRPATLYENAKVRNPARWTRGVRNWRLPNAVFLNPERNPESEKIQAAA